MQLATDSGLLKMMRKKATGLLDLEGIAGPRRWSAHTLRGGGADAGVQSPQG